MSMPDHIKYNNFWPKRSHSPRKRQNWILLFFGEPTHISKISYPFGVEAAVQNFQGIHVFGFEFYPPYAHPRIQIHEVPPWGTLF